MDGGRVAAKDESRVTSLTQEMICQLSSGERETHLLLYSPIFLFHGRRLVIIVVIIPIDIPRSEERRHTIESVVFFIVSSCGSSPHVDHNLAEKLDSAVRHDTPSQIECPQWNFQFQQINEHLVQIVHHLRAQINAGQDELFQ